MTAINNRHALLITRSIMQLSFIRRASTLKALLATRTIAIIRSAIPSAFVKVTTAAVIAPVSQTPLVVVQPVEAIVIVVYFSGRLGRQSRAGRLSLLLRQIKRALLLAKLGLQRRSMLLRRLDHRIRRDTARRLLTKRIV